MNKNTKRMLITILILALITATGIIINHQQAKTRLASLENEEIILKHEGEEVKTVKFQDILEMDPVDFEAKLKSSTMLFPEDRNYKGVSLSKVFEFADVSLEGMEKVLVGSLDGYLVPLKIEEVESPDNIFLVYEEDGKILKPYGEPDGQGPFMLVVRGDKFSQRWAKYVTELDIR